MAEAIGAMTESLAGLGREPHVVTVGGGHGQSVVLQALSHLPCSITAVVSTADDGGCSGQLRQRGMAPPGDLRRCLLALATDERRKDALARRTAENRSLGNLLLAEIWENTRDLQSASDKVGRWLGARGRVCPAVDGSATLVAVSRMDDIIYGETNVDALQAAVDELFVEANSTHSNPDVARALEEADLIIICPGSLFTSVLACLLSGGISAAVAQSRAPKLFVANLHLTGEEQKRCGNIVESSKYVFRQLGGKASSSEWFTLTDGPRFAVSVDGMVYQAAIRSEEHRHHPDRLGIAFRHIIPRLLVSESIKHAVDHLSPRPSWDV